jgi:hypothetical protein
MRRRRCARRCAGLGDILSASHSTATCRAGRRPSSGWSSAGDGDLLHLGYGRLPTGWRTFTNRVGNHRVGVPPGFQTRGTQPRRLPRDALRRGPDLRRPDGRGGVRVPGGPGRPLGPRQSQTSRAGAGATTSNTSSRPTGGPPPRTWPASSSRPSSCSARPPSRPWVGRPTIGELGDTDSCQEMTAVGLPRPPMFPRPRTVMTKPDQGGSVPPDVNHADGRQAADGRPPATVRQLL